MLNISESFLNILTDADQPNGYVSVDALGNANIATIKAATPTGLFLRDDGTWNTLGATWGGITGLINNQTDLVALVNTRLALSDVDTDAALTANSDSKVASQKAIKTYVGNQLIGYQPLVSPGTTSQYWRGDKTWQTLALATVLGISNTTGGNNIVMSGTDVITDALISSSFLDLNSQRLYFFDGTNRFAVQSDLSSGVIELNARDMVSISLEHSYVQTLVNGVNIGAYSQSSGNETKLTFSNTTSEISSTYATYAGLTYNADYSANYTNRSLVDKGYVASGFMPLTLTGNTTINLGTYDLTFDAGANTARLILNATNATDAKIFSFRSAGLQRWDFRIDGANDDFAIRRYNNAGAFVDAPISIDRTAGTVTFNNAISVYSVTSTGATGTGSLVFGTSPTFTTDITTPLIIGGTAVGSLIQYKGTTVNGTSTVAAHQFLVGNNGATTAAQIFNSGQISIGNYASPTNLRAFTIGQNTAYMSFGSLVGSTSNSAIYLNEATPSATNYTLAYTAANEISINAVSVLRIRANNTLSATATTSGFTINASGGLYVSNTSNDTKLTTTRTGGNTWSIQHSGSRFYFYDTTSLGEPLSFYNDGRITSIPVASASGAITNFTFTKPNNTGQTASIAINGVLWTLGSRQWATGAITTQKEFELTSPTYSFVETSTITDAYTLFVTSPTAGTKAIITNNWALGTNGAISCGGLFSIIDYNIVFGTTTGTKIGTATTQKLSFWNATPIVQPTTAVAAATFVANTSLIANDTATFDGYTIGQVVKALRNTGLLA